jgi:zinc and cadmium transporter
MATLQQVILFSLAGGLFSLIGGVILLKSKTKADKLSHYVVPFAAGALLAAVFLDLLKEGVHLGDAESVLVSALVGVLLFFFAERSLRWFHHHHEHKDEKSANKALIVVGDTLHNAIDGVVIAAGFLVSVPTGIVTTIAVAAHEIPQEIGDFGLLLSKGMKRKKILIINVLSALATTVMAIITFQLGSSDKLPVGVLLGLSAGFLLYIAASDIIPTIHEKASSKKIIDAQAIMLLFGVLLVGSIISIAHDYIDGDDHHGHSTSHHEHATDSHAHSEYVVGDNEVAPVITELHLTPDEKSGYNLEIQVDNFVFAPQNVNGENKLGEGHAHLYINDKKIGRLYSNFVHLADVSEGDTIRVTLNMNDHSDIVYGGKMIEKSIVVGGKINDDHRHIDDEGDDHHDAPHHDM